MKNNQFVLQGQVQTNFGVDRLLNFGMYSMLYKHALTGSMLIFVLLCLVGHLYHSVCTPVYGFVSSPTSGVHLLDGKNERMQKHKKQNTRTTGRFGS